MITSRRAAVLLLATVAVLATAPRRAGAQENFEIQVYGAETTKAGETMVELHSNLTADGQKRRVNGIAPTQGAVHETLEITHGWTEWFETAIYLFTSVQPSGGWEWVGSHLRPRVRVPEAWHWPVGVSLSLEAGYQRRRYAEDTWTLEIRPIVDQQIGPWYWAFNPTVGTSLKGENQGRGFDFSPSVKVAYSLSSVVAAGIEYYGGLGPIDHIDRPRDQQHQIFPVVDLDLGPQWEFNFGVGFGLTRSTEGFIVKMILGRRF